ncbi:murein DD-endopeptidase MepM/ murein hydrolase activator NlpD [Pseudonocardia hierapolitana]|uniref:Murein DD-endopeptidase MepM/ murein hydrolase activator NlpD n=1 Tax=Pseudonocardia hierapolitana TaxID=1128676 RepID=A0A561SIY1_9PSEU|nr:M23 family metallopeptidase [Pseudonocardia hierapolitana]TWF74838.1 murein DD-endopeptidase MepM/ murein hydrolase activator NlpD [Pseudonocardia hierapolitana]
MARHRSPQGRHAHLGPPLSAALAAAGVGAAHRSVPVQQLTSSLPARFVATVVAGGALAATAQHALAQTLPVAADGAALRAAVEELIGVEPASAPAEAFDVTDATSVAFAPVVSDVAADLPADLQLADAASLVKAADMQRAAAEAAAAARAAEEAEAAAEAAKAAEAARAAEEAAKKAEATSAGSALQMIAGRVTSGFGSRWGRAHEGLDIAAPIGTPIRAPLAGTVIESGPASGFGMWVRVRHDDGTVTTYGHINRSMVRKGQQVAAGELIAEVGNRGRSTGPHLHIEVETPNGNKINPRPWLDKLGIDY